MGYGGYFVGFDMHFQLMDNPIIYKRRLEENECKLHPSENGKPYFWELTLTDGTYIRGIRNKNLLCLVNLQKQIDEIVKVWKEYIEYSQNI